MKSKNFTFLGFFYFFLLCGRAALALTEGEVTELYDGYCREWRSYPLTQTVYPAVRVVEKLTTDLCGEADLKQAEIRVSILRQIIAMGQWVGGISDRPATPTERNLIIQGIFIAETAQELMDGNYYFHFCNKEHTGSYGTRKSIRGAYVPHAVDSEYFSKRADYERNHLTAVYLYARMAHLAHRGDNPTTVKDGVERTIDDRRHLPVWMGQIYKRDYQGKIETLYRELGGAEAASKLLVGMRLTETRLKDREVDQKGRTRLKGEAKIGLGMTTNVDDKEYPQEAALIEKHEVTFDFMAISPNGSCKWYVDSIAQYYGYMEAWDILELLPANVWIEMLKSSGNFMREGLPYHLDLDHRIKPNKFFSLLKNYFDRNNVSSAAMEQYFIDNQIPSEIREMIKDEPMHQALLKCFLDYLEYRCFRVKSLPDGVRSIVVEDAKNKQWGISSDNTLSSELLSNRDLSSFHHSLSAYEQGHTSRLVPSANDPANILAWVKGKTHEIERDVHVDAGYLSTWVGTT